MFFYVLTHLLYNFGIKPNKAFDLMRSFQAAINVEEELLGESFPERILENSVSEIPQLIETNSQIMFMKDSLGSLRRPTDEIQSSTAVAEEITVSIIEVARTSTLISEKTNPSVEYTGNSELEIGNTLNEFMKTGDIFSMIMQESLQKQLQRQHLRCLY